MCNNNLCDKNIAIIKDICNKFDNDPSELISILHAVQGRFGYLPEEVQREIAINLNAPLSKIFGVVTFYSFFTMVPKGKYAISVCTGTACYVCGAEKITEELERLLEIKVGQTTKDGKFSLDTLRCVGACGLAPVLLIGKKIYGRAKVEDMKDLVNSCK